MCLLPQSHYFTDEIFKWYIFSGHKIGEPEQYCALKPCRLQCRKRFVLEGNGGNLNISFKVAKGQAIKWEETGKCRDRRINDIDVCSAQNEKGFCFSCLYQQCCTNIMRACI